jgi:hypothetical protein
MAVIRREIRKGLNSWPIESRRDLPLSLDKPISYLIYSFVPYLWSLIFCFESSFLGAQSQRNRWSGCEKTRYRSAEPMMNDKRASLRQTRIVLPQRKFVDSPNAVR